VPQHYLLYVGLAPGQQAPFGPPAPEAVIDVDAVAWPFGRIDTVGGPYAYQPGGSPVENSRCLAITAVQAEAMASAEAKVGAKRALDQQFGQWDYSWTRGKGSISVMTRWLLPYQALDCTDANVW
jgi:hypothetical protein